MGSVGAGIGGEAVGAFEVQRQTDGVDLRNNSTCVYNLTINCRALRIEDAGVTRSKHTANLI